MADLLRLEMLPPNSNATCRRVPHLLKHNGEIISIDEGMQRRGRGKSVE
jgi:hypothetical protein